jgi:hypothetical protein
MLCVFGLINSGYRTAGNSTKPRKLTSQIWREAALAKIFAIPSHERRFVAKQQILS